MIEKAIERPVTSQGRSFYYLNLVGLIFFVALVLLALVDFRRGFLFSEYTKSPFSAFNISQVILLVAGIIGAWGCHRALKTYQNDTALIARSLKILTFSLFALLIFDLITYRAVPTVRAIDAGKVGADWLKAFEVTGWAKPIALTVSYFLTVWHATMLGILIAGLALTTLPQYLKKIYTRKGFLGTLMGALYAIPQPFCSCCASTMVPSYQRCGASTQFSLAFVVASPMLNITAIILAFSLLPVQFAATRLVGGIALTLIVTYFVARFSDKWDQKHEAKSNDRPTGPLKTFADRLFKMYLRAFNVEALMENRAISTPAELLSNWLRVSGRLALVLVPTLLIWTAITSGLLEILPSTFSNDFAGVVLAAFTGTLFMISTWSEIPIALQMINAGNLGPAAAMLLVLPPVSLPCLMLLGGATSRFKTVLLLGGCVMVTGILAGLLFL